MDRTRGERTSFRANHPTRFCPEAFPKAALLCFSSCCIHHLTTPRPDFHLSLDSSLLLSNLCSLPGCHILINNLGHAPTKLTPSAVSESRPIPPPMDANSSKQGALGRVLSEKLSEKLTSGPSSPIVPAPSNHLSIDTQAAALRNGAYDSPATASRIPNGQIEEVVRSQHFTLRTLPRMSMDLSFPFLDLQ
jgi:hypothetical protein